MKLLRDWRPPISRPTQSTTRRTYDNHCTRINLIKNVSATKKGNLS